MSYEPYRHRYRYYAADGPFNIPGRSAGTVSHAIYQAVESVGHTITQLARGFETNRRERQAVEVLSGLSDDTLKDIGVAKSEIRTVARRFAENPNADYRTFS